MLASKPIQSHLALIGIHGLLALLVVLFSGRIETGVAFLVTLALPGYVLSRLFIEEELVRALVAFPLSVFLLGALSVIGSWFTVAVVNEWLVVGVWLLVLGLRFFDKRRWVIPLPAQEKPLPLTPVQAIGLIALVIGFGFASYVFYLADGSLSHAFPNQVNAYDKVLQLTWVSHAAATGDAVLPPALHEGRMDVQSSLLPPASVWPTALLARISGMFPWDAQHAFAALVHAITIGLVAWMTRQLFGWRTACIVAVVAAIPYLPFLAGDMAGMYRVSMVVMLAPLLWISSEWILQRRANAPLWMGIWVSALMLIHPVSFILLLPMIGFWLFAWRSGNLDVKPLLIPFAMGLFFLFAYGWPIFSGVDDVFGPHVLLGEIRWTDPFRFDLELSSLVGPVLFLKYYWVHLLAGIITSAILIFLAWKKSSSVSSEQVRLALMVVFLGVITLGFTNVYYQYLPKLRSTLFFVFLIPLVVFAIHAVAQRLLQRHNPYAGVAATLVIGLLLVSPVLGPALGIKPKVDEISYDAILAVQRNASPSASVMAILGFYQHSHLLTNRYGDYFSESSKLALALEGIKVDVGPYCLPGFRRTGLFELEKAPCTVRFASLRDYDYLMADFGVVNRNTQLVQAYSSQLEGIGFVPVFVNSDVAVYKNIGSLASLP